MGDQRHSHGRRHGHAHRHGPIEGRASKRYDVLARRVMRGVYRRVAADLSGSLPADAAMLDVGTGPGVLLMELSRTRPDLALTGVDLSADMIEAATRNLGDKAVLRTADVAELPFDPGSFDLVTASLSAHHWTEPDAGVAEIARVLRPGGKLVVYDFEFAPWDALSSPEQFDHIGRGRFRTGWGRLLRCQRFEATAVGG